MFLFTFELLFSKLNLRMSKKSYIRKRNFRSITEVNFQRKTHFPENVRFWKPNNVYSTPVLQNNAPNRIFPHKGFRIV